jgi:cell division septation protein DedD
VLQVAALSSQEKAAELQARLRGIGISSHTEKAGELIKVKHRAAEQGRSRESARQAGPYRPVGLRDPCLTP